MILSHSCNHTRLEIDRTYADSQARRDGRPRSRVVELIAGRYTNGGTSTISSVLIQGMCLHR